MMAHLTRSLRKKGVASFILEKAHQVVVIHCSSHNLN